MQIFLAYSTRNAVFKALESNYCLTLSVWLLQSTTYSFRCFSTRKRRVQPRRVQHAALSIACVYGIYLGFSALWAIINPSDPSQERVIEFTTLFSHARCGNYSLCYQVHYVARMTFCHAGIYKEFFAVQGH